MVSITRRGVVGMVLAMTGLGRPATAVSRDYAATMAAIAADIAQLKAEFPQLVDFSPLSNLDRESLVIRYQYRTHRPRAENGLRGGWSAGVPNPDADGVWFYLNLHDPGSLSQIDTQPAMLPICLGRKRVTFLILEGKETKPLGGRIFTILKRHGATDCGRP